MKLIYLYACVRVCVTGVNRIDLKQKVMKFKKRSERRKQCALAVVGGAKNFRPATDPSRGRTTAKI